MEHNRYMYCINFHLPDTCSVVFLLLFSNIRPTRCNFTQFIYIWNLLYMFRMLLSPIIRSEYNCIYSIWYLSHRYCCLPLSWKSWNSSTKRQIAVTVWLIPDAVDTVVFAPDDGWRHRPKHVEQFPDKNKLCKVASCWTYIGIYLRCADPWTLTLLLFLSIQKINPYLAKVEYMVSS